MSKGQFFLYFAAAGILTFTAVFALFAFIRPECYPRKVMRMSSTDMRMTSPVSTFWCEAMELSSDHPFLAFRMSKEPRISPISLSRNEVDLKLKLKPFETHRVQYFLLPATLVTAIMCSTHPGAVIYVASGNDINNYEEHSAATVSNESNEDLQDDDDDDYSEEVDDSSDEQTRPITWSKVLKFQEIPVKRLNDEDCEISSSNKLFQVNITSADTYYVVVQHKGPTTGNFVKIRLFLDRSSYDIQTGVRSVHVCSGGLFTSSCTVRLNFLSKDRVLIKIPGEPGAGLSTFRVRSSCKPRFSLITIMSLIIPFGLLSFSALFAIYIRRTVIKKYLRRSHGGRISTLSSPLLNFTADDEVRDTEQGIMLDATKVDEGTAKDVHFPPRYSVIASDNGSQTAQEISDDPPPSYQSMKFDPEDTAK